MRLHIQCSVNKSGQHVNCSLSRALVVFAPHTAGVCDGPKHRAEIRTSCWKLHLACVHPCPKQLISFRSGRVDVFDRQMTETHRSKYLYRISVGIERCAHLMSPNQHLSCSSLSSHAVQSHLECRRRLSTMHSMDMVHLCTSAKFLTAGHSRPLEIAFRNAANCMQAFRCTR